MFQQLIEDHRREMQRLRDLNADMDGILRRIRSMLNAGDLLFNTCEPGVAPALMEAIEDVAARAEGRP